jgi:hypothetical protein
MNKTVKGFVIGVVTTLIVGISGTVFASNGYFQDNGWWTPAAEWAKDQGLMTGLGNGNFGGDQPVTRGQLSQVLKNLADSGAITINKSVQQPATTPVPQPNPTPIANEVTLGTGTFYVGKDIKAGRYIVSTNNRGGNFFVYDKDGSAVVNEMLGTNTDFYVNNITTELSDGEKIEISSLQSVKFILK